MWLLKERQYETLIIQPRCDQILQEVCVINCRRWTGKIRKYGQQDGHILINIKFVFIYLFILFSTFIYFCVYLSIAKGFMFLIGV